MNPCVRTIHLLLIKDSASSGLLRSLNFLENSTRYESIIIQATLFSEIDPSVLKKADLVMLDLTHLKSTQIEKFLEWKPCLKEKPLLAITDTQSATFFAIVSQLNIPNFLPADQLGLRSIESVFDQVFREDISRSNANGGSQLAQLYKIQLLEMARLSWQIIGQAPRLFWALNSFVESIHTQLSQELICEAHSLEGMCHPKTNCNTQSFVALLQEMTQSGDICQLRVQKSELPQEIISDEHGLLLIMLILCKEIQSRSVVDFPDIELKISSQYLENKSSSLHLEVAYKGEGFFADISGADSGYKWSLFSEETRLFTVMELAKHLILIQGGNLVYRGNNHDGLSINIVLPLPRQTPLIMVIDPQMTLPSCEGIFPMTCLHCTSGEEALLRAHELQPDLIVSNLLLPDMTGVELLDKLKSDISLSGIPLVFWEIETLEQDWNLPSAFIPKDSESIQTVMSALFPKRVVV